MLLKSARRPVAGDVVAVAFAKTTLINGGVFEAFVVVPEISWVWLAPPTVATTPLGPVSVFEAADELAFKLWLCSAVPPVVEALPPRR